MSAVINLLQTPILLAGGNGELPFPVLITNDFTLAQKYAYQQWGDIETVWLNLREQQSLILDYASDEDEEFWDEHGSTLIEQRQRFSELDICHDIDADLFNCYLNEKCGLQSPFWQSLWQAYQAGYWPCGWQGAYPNGKLVVYTQS